jgi:crotonobetainyl-CoA:carnitine CoA-transferase CaiB-like acyl-CoA transferase
MSQGIFNGLKVIDCASFIAGPAAGTILSDFGADVIKIEPPGKGDPHRFLYALEPNPRNKRNYFWQLDNRNKRGLALNLKSPAAVEIMKKLLAKADVFIINYPPHVRQALGLTYENIRVLNPRIIYADISGYGEKGPEADKPGFDLTAYWARTGLMDATRNAGSPPTIPVSGIGDHATASTLYGAIVTGLYRREKTGMGCKVSTSLVGEGAWAASGWIKAALDGSSVSGAATDRDKPHNALANTYATSDGRWLILVFVGEDKDWPGLVKALERPDLLTDPRFVDSHHRHANAIELGQVLNQEFAKRPLNYWREVLDREHTTFGVVQTISEIAKDPQLIANDIIRPIEGANEDSGEFTVDSPIKIESEDKVRPRPAPRLGQHSIEILQEMGYKLADILLLANAGVIEVEQVKEK